MPYYPVFLELNGRPCLVVGGGHVALGKVRGLLAAGADVTLVSPRIRPELQELVESGRIACRVRGYAAEDLNGAAIVMVATDDRDVNARVAADCRARRIWVNVADDPPYCDFILPSVVRKGQITLAISTSGASPALARRLREELETFLSDDFEPLADLLAEVRRDLQARRIAIDADVWQRAIDGQLRALLAQRRYGQARSRLLANLGIEPVLAATRDLADPTESDAEIQNKRH